MKPAKGLHKAIWAVVIASELLVGGLSATSKPSPQSGAETVGGLQITISLDQAEGVQSKAPRFRVELHNVGSKDLTLNLGFMLGNGEQYPDAVVLLLTDAQKTFRRFELRGPWAIAGSVDPLVVPLPAGSTFSIPVDMGKYWVPSSKEFDYKFTAGAYSIEAQFTGKNPDWLNRSATSIAVLSYWKGTVRSNLLRFEVPR